MPANIAAYTKIVMGMPVTVMVPGGAPRRAFDEVYALFDAADARFSSYRADSEVSRINRGLPETAWSSEMCDVLARCRQTSRLSYGYFDPYRAGRLDPSGLVKGWAIRRAARLLTRRGYQDFFIDAGGDIQAHGNNGEGQPWRIGIRNPFDRREVVKVLSVRDRGVATSGAYVRGQHIYDPHAACLPADVASLTVIGPDVYEADRFATAAYAMGVRGAAFIESLQGFEAYLVDSNGMATMTSGFARYAA